MTQAPLRRRCVPRLDLLEDRTLLSVCVVDRLTDVGEGKDFVGDLRYCLEQAQDEDRIQFGVEGTINLTRALPDLTRSISIQGPGADLLTVRRDTGGFYRIFTVSSSAALNISGLTISNGFVQLFGGGIFNSGMLTISNSTISRNACEDGAGGISNSGTLTISNSTISGNSGGETGGGFSNTGTLTISNSTISDNESEGFSGGEGGGIRNFGILVVSNSTISGNRTSFGPGGGIFNSRTLHMRNTILAGNRAESGPDLWGSLTSSGYNLIANTEGGSGYVETDLLDVDPLLGPLADNGGPTWTHALLPGSPAIDTGDNTDAPEWDQRGEGFPRIVNKIIDRGAFEVQAERAPPAPDWLLVADVISGLTSRRPDSFRAAHA